MTHQGPGQHVQTHRQRMVSDDAGNPLAGERMLVLAIVHQALVDLADPAEAADAEEFLTLTLWGIEDEDGLAWRDFAPEMFTESNRLALLERVRAIRAGEEKAPAQADVGVVSYEEIAEMVSK